MCRYAALGSFIDMGIKGVAVATVLNKAGAFTSPYNCPFPFHQDELPPNIASSNWNTLNFNATGVAQCSLHQLKDWPMLKAGNNTVHIPMFLHCPDDMPVHLIRIFSKTSCHHMPDGACWRFLRPCSEGSMAERVPCIMQ